MRRHVYYICFLTLLLISLFLAVPAYALEAFEITAYDIQMDVRSDNSYKISETIDVRFIAQRHGIIRTIPLKTYGGGWASVRDVKVLEHKYSTARADGNLEIKIGDANRFAGTAERYSINYVYDIGDDGLRDMDELYFNLIGTDWDCPIDNITFAITMPFAFDESKLNFTYGKKGSTESSRVNYAVNGTTITGRLTGPLQPNEALTVALPLPQGYYTDVKSDSSSLLARFGWLLPLLLIVAGIAVWIALGKKRQIFPTVEFYPPQGTTSADVGFLIDGRVDPFDVTSLIVYWADKGYLSITEQRVKRGFFTKKTFLLTKLNEMGDEAKPYEQKMFNDLFTNYGNGTEVNTEQLEQRFYITTDLVKKMVKSSFEDSPDTSIFASSSKTCRRILWLLAVLAPVPVLMIIFQRSTGRPAGIEVIGSVLLFTIIIVVTYGMFANLLVSWQGLPKRGLLGTLLRSTLPAIIFSFFTILIADTSGLLAFMTFSLAAAFILIWLSFRCDRRTQLGDWYLERLIGLKEFLKVTELDRIKLLVDENPQYFYNVLPYAMVLGVTDKWIRNFDGIAIAPPDWYRSDTAGGAFNVGIFARDLDQGLRIVSAGMISRPSSQGGSSDGGSAGGGSGGGGGRSW